MDIFKLSNDYLKKINKTASELNRRLVFLNEINNSVPQKNMIGGSLADLDTIINENDSNIRQILTKLDELDRIENNYIEQSAKLQTAFDAMKEEFDKMNSQSSELIKKANSQRVLLRDGIKKLSEQSDKSAFKINVGPNPRGDVTEKITTRRP